MVQVRVRQHHRVDIRWRHGKRRPVAQPQRLHALEQAAIEQDAASAGFQQMARAVTVPAAPRKRRVGEMGMDPPLSGFQLRMRRPRAAAGRTGAESRCADPAGSTWKQPARAHSVRPPRENKHASERTHDQATILRQRPDARLPDHAGHGGPGHQRRHGDRRRRHAHRAGQRGDLVRRQDSVHQKKLDHWLAQLAEERR